MLDFVGIPSDRQVLVTGIRTPRAISIPVADRPLDPPRGNPLDPRRCVVLVPFSGFIHPQCDSSLKELERRGYEVRRVDGYSAIDQGRNQMATDALVNGFEETMWIDSDIGFDPDDLEKLRKHGLPIVCGIYPQKGKRAVACHVLPGTRSLRFGESGGLVEILYAGAGFLFVRREAYLGVQLALGLPVCNERFNSPMIPFFQPLLHPFEDGHWYLAEDFAFSERARRSGFKIYADTSIRLWHIGSYGYGWEEAGLEPSRFATFQFDCGDALPHGENAESSGKASAQPTSDPDGKLLN
jgi:hypothetical protein